MSLAPETVLVVEDEAITALDLQQSLRRRGFHVPSIATNGEEAIQLVQKHPPDLALIDIRLGSGMDGIETARVLRGQFNIPIVFLTAYADAATLQRAKSAEPSAYLLKPFEETLLAITIAIAVNKHRAYSLFLDEAEAAVDLSESRFRQIAETIADHSVQILDTGARIISWNAGATLLHGWGPEEALGKDCSMLYPPEEATTWKQSLESASRLGRKHHYVPQLRKDHTRFAAEVILVMLRTAQGIPAGFLRVSRAFHGGNN